MSDETTPVSQVLEAWRTRAEAGRHLNLAMEVRPSEVMAVVAHVGALEELTKFPAPRPPRPPRRPRAEPVTAGPAGPMPPSPEQLEAAVAAIGGTAGEGAA